MTVAEPVAAVDDSGDSGRECRWDKETRFPQKGWADGITTRVGAVASRPWHLGGRGAVSRPWHFAGRGAVRQIIMDTTFPEPATRGQAVFGRADLCVFEPALPA
ncbi:hypothetical protein GCM10018952_08240 [Streptosporangium vulgare]